MSNSIFLLSALALVLTLAFTAACGSSPAPEPASVAPAAPAAPMLPAPPVAPQPQAPAAPAPAAPQTAPPIPAAPQASRPAPSAPQIMAQSAQPTAAPQAASSAPAAPQAAPATGSITMDSASSAYPKSSGAAPPIQQTAPAATTFQDYERTPFVRTEVDSVSTFSLDTDRTSYHLALNWVREGYDIEPDSVRAEEWINAFDYRYDHPSRVDSFAVHTDVIPHPLDSDMVLARIGFQAPELRDDGIPLNVTLVLDASGSMSDGNRVDIAREAAESIRRSLRKDDRIGVVHFTDGIIHDLTVPHKSPDSKDVQRSIKKLKPHGSTNVQAGLDLGVELAHEARYERPHAYNYIILMSDGVANVDATNPFAILESAADYSNTNPLRLITIGVGIENYNDYLLEQLAQHGNGWYRYLNDVEQARATFSRDNWLALSIPFADQTRAQVTWNRKLVESWRIIGYENRITADENFTQARKEFAEIPSGAATTVFYELDLTDYASHGDLLNLGDVELRWVTPVNNDSNRQHAQILAQYTEFPRDMDSALLKLGALVALASDRYSSLPYPDYPAYQAHPDKQHNVHRDLATIKEELHDLDRHLFELQAYGDFVFLMEHMAQDIPKQASGYSR